MWIKHPIESSNKQHKDTKREDTNNQATKSFKSYCQSVEIQGLHNTLMWRVQESNLFSNLLYFSTNVIISVALKDGDIFVTFVVET